MIINFKLPKSTPSDTFPLTTERRRAPRPFSQAYVYNIDNDILMKIEREREKGG